MTGLSALTDNVTDTLLPTVTEDDDAYRLVLPLVAFTVLNVFRQLMTIQRATTAILSILFIISLHSLILRYVLHAKNVLLDCQICLQGYFCFSADRSGFQLVAFQLVHSQDVLLD